MQHLEIANTLNGINYLMLNEMSSDQVDPTKITERGRG